MTILFNEPILHADHPDAESEHEILYTVDAVHETLSAAGYAEFHPVAPNDAPEGRARNRRVDVVILNPVRMSPEQ